jgi:pimeloyl-ACP methyl ester carboxylesterase
LNAHPVGIAVIRGHFDVLAAVHYLRKIGAKSVAIVGGSMGGYAAGVASVEAKPGEIDRLVFVGSEGGDKSERRRLAVVRACQTADAPPPLSAMPPLGHGATGSLSTIARTSPTDKRRATLLGRKRARTTQQQWLRESKQPQQCARFTRVVTYR